MATQAEIQAYLRKKKQEEEERRRQQSAAIAPIAPITTQTDTGNGWVKGGLLSDGYQFGDVLGSIFGTVGDVASGIVQGAGSLVEGVVDLGIYGVGGVASLFGANDFAEGAKQAAMFDASDYLVGGFRDVTGISDASFLDENLYGIAQGLGQVGAIAATAGLASAGGASAAANAITTGMTFASGMGGGISEAYSNNATDEEAFLYGALQGGIDTITEMMFAGLGKGVKAFGYGGKALSSADDMVAKAIGSKVKSTIAKNAAEFGVKATAEGIEELAAGFGSAVAKQMTYMSDEDFGKLLEDEKLFDQFVMGLVTSGIVQLGGKSGLINTTRKGQDFVTGLTKNEQAVIDRIAEEQIKQKEKNGEKLSKKEKNAIYETVTEDLEKGNISTSVIEEMFGGDSYKAYQDAIEKDNNAIKELKKLYQGEELQKKIDNIVANSERTKLQEELSKNVREQFKDTKLEEAYLEKDRGGENFRADLSKVDEKLRATYQKAIDSGVLNNRRKTHEAVDWLARIAAKKGIEIDFTNTKKILESGLGVKNAVVNGYTTDKGFAVNVESSKYINTTVGHEITHILEDSKGYDALAEIVEEYATEKGIYADRYRKAIDLYETVDGYKGANGQEKIKKEVIADLVGDYLFTDKEFVHSLYVKDRNIFQRIFDEIKYLCKMATAGSEEAKKLLALQKTFQEVYNGTYKTEEEAKTEAKTEQKTEAKEEVATETEAQAKTETEAETEVEQPVAPLAEVQLSEDSGKQNTETEAKVETKTDAQTEEEARLARQKRFDEILDFSYKVKLAEDVLLRGENATEAAMERASKEYEELKPTLDAVGYDPNTWTYDDLVRALHDSKDLFQTKVEKGGTTYSLSEYSEHQKQNWANSKRIVVYENSEQLSKFVQDSISDKTMNKKMYFGAIPSDFASKIKAETGLDVEKYNLSLGSYEIRKILKDHGDEKTEAKRGQRAITEDDFAHVMDIVLNANNIQLSKDAYMGKPAIVFSGEYNGKMNVVAVVSDKRLDLFVQTAYANVKKENLATPIGEQAPINTPEANNGTVFSNNSIPQPSDFVKRYSLTDIEGEHPIKRGDFAIRGEDIRLEQPLAPLPGDVSQDVESVSVDPRIEKLERKRDRLLNELHRIEEETRNKEAEGDPSAWNYYDTVLAAYDKITREIEQLKEKDIAPLPKKEESNGKAMYVPSGEVVEGESSTKTKSRSWPITSTESEAVDGKVLIEDLADVAVNYTPISNKTTLDKANAKLNESGYEKSVQYFESKFETKSDSKNVALEDIALGERLIQEAVKKGDYRTASRLIEDIAILGTELGQKVQALSIIKKLTPEGQIQMMKKVIARRKGIGDKAYSDVNLTEAMEDKILGVYNEDGTYDQDALNQAVEEVKQEIADEMKVTGFEKANAWRYLSMLGNPKTHIRNIISNVAMKATNSVKNALARSIEDVAGAVSPVAPIIGEDGAVTNYRTKTWKRATKEVKDFANQVTNEMKETVTDGGKYGGADDIKAKRDIFKNKILKALYNFNNEWLSKEDWWFSRSAFKNAYTEFLTANNIQTKEDIANNPKLVEQGKRYAEEQAQIATFRQTSWIANKISEIENKNTATKIIVGSILPFKTTPINVAKTAINYSPLGFAKTLLHDAPKVKKGEMEASQLIDKISQNMTGTALTLAGYLLASMGTITGGGDDDREGMYDSQLGEQTYSLNLGGNSYSLSWLSPVAMPLFVGANAYEQLVEQEEWNGDVVVETLAKTLDPLSEMSFLSSLNDVLSSYKSGMAKFAGIAESTLQNYVTQFAPTLLSQVATVSDDTKRTTKVSGDSDFRFLDETINKLKLKIPGLRQSLEPSTDIWGNEIKQTENVIARAFESFLSPSSVKQNIASNVDAEIKSLYSAVGENAVIPTVPDNYINYKDGKYKMSAQEYTQFKKAYGQTSYLLLNELFKTNSYKNATAEDRADWVKDVYEFARDEAKKAFLERKGVEYTNATKEGVEYYKPNPIQEAIEYDLPPDEYSFFVEYPEKYAFLLDNGYSYSTYKNADEDGKRALTWASENPAKYQLSKAVTGDLFQYKSIVGKLNDLSADKNSVGVAISGSRKKKVVNYINELDLEYGEKIILYKSEYPGDDSYNLDIVEYLNGRDDLSYDQVKTILEELGMKVGSNGSVSW